MATRKLPGGGKGQDKLIADAIRVSLMRAAEKGKSKRLQLVADKLVDRAIEGDVAAIREIADRIDGRVPQAVSGHVDSNITVRWRALNES